MGLFQKVARRFNRAVEPLVESGRLGGSMAVVSYTGRRSGKRVSLPVAFQHSGDQLTIEVVLAGRKTWWRNFLGDGGPITVRVKGVDHTGHAVARRDDAGRVTVLVELAPGGTAS